MKRWLAFAPLAVLAALGLLFGIFALHHDPRVTPEALKGKPAPDVTLPKLADSTNERLKAEVKGPTLVNFFASWCVPCVTEQSALLALKAEGVRIVGVAYKDKPAATRAFLDRLGDPFAVVLTDTSGDAGVEFGVSGVPETYLIDDTGMILDKHTGPLSPQDAEAMLEKAKHRP
jgi:cytochrome c biogenesis protein CcmG, thiol:disulfide interchange protein DsbE